MLRGRVLTFILFLILAGCARLPMEPQEDLAMTPILSPAPITSPLVSALRAKRATVFITVDAGHGGKDTGALSTQSDLPEVQEKVAALATAQLLQKHLEVLGYRVQMTRENDQFLTLDERAQMANESNATLFVSVHYNAAENPSAHGIEVFCFGKSQTPPEPGAGKELAEAVLKSVITKTGATSRGVKAANFAVLRKTKMPAILVEGGFLTNREERQQIDDPTYRRQLAWGIANGIDEYVQNSLN